MEVVKVLLVLLFICGLLLAFQPTLAVYVGDKLVPVGEQGNGLIIMAATLCGAVLIVCAECLERIERELRKPRR